MTVRKPLALLAIIAVAALAACADVTGPTQTNGFCAITGGPGTCDDGMTAHK